MTPEVAVLEVRLHGRRIGAITNLPGDRNHFTFDEAYVTDADRPVLSLSFRDTFGGLITEVPPTQTRLPPFFANLLPEGALRDYLAARAGVDRARDFFLLAVLGKDLPGALEVEPAGDWIRLGEDPEVADSAAEGYRGSADALRFSLAGLQLKFSAIQEARGGLTIPTQGVGGNWIVKLPSPAFAAVPENEFAMLTLAGRIGIEVPAIALVRVADVGNLPPMLNLAGESALSIRRFDRLADGTRVHIEDFAQVFGVYPERKYERASYLNIARVLWTVAGEEAIAEFLRRLVFNTLIGNGDMHLKNWSIIYPDWRTPRLAPAYDFVSTVAYLPNERLALGFGGSRDFAEMTYERFERFAVKAGLPAVLTRRTVRETVDRFRQVWRGSGDVPMDEAVREAIERHLGRMLLWTEA